MTLYLVILTMSVTGGHIMFSVSKRFNLSGMTLFEGKKEF